MTFARSIPIALLALCGASLAAAEPMSVEEFRSELVGAPLCGAPDSGPYAGKMLCTVHLPDGTAVMAGQGLVVRGTWELDGTQSLPQERAGPARAAALHRIREGRAGPLPQQRWRQSLHRAVSLTGDGGRRRTFTLSAISLSSFRRDLTYCPPRDSSWEGL